MEAQKLFVRLFSFADSLLTHSDLSLVFSIAAVRRIHKVEFALSDTRASGSASPIALGSARLLRVKNHG